MLQIFPEGSDAHSVIEWTHLEEMLQSIESTSAFRDQEAEDQRSHYRMNVRISKPWSLATKEEKKRNALNINKHK